EPGNYHVVDVFFLPGVTDTLAESVLAGARMLGIPGLEHVETGRRYMLDSRLSQADVRSIAQALLYNPVIQQYAFHPAGENKNAGSSHFVASLDAQDIAPRTVPEETQDDAGHDEGPLPWFPTLPFTLTRMSAKDCLAA